MKLHNTINGEELKEKIKASDEKRTTISFYKYAQIGNPQLFRDHLFFHWDQLGILGRIYVAYEGINAQLSVPTKNLEAYKAELENITFLKGVRLNFAVDDNGKSFFKLAIKVRSKIVADGLEDDLFDVSKPGNYLNVEEFNNLTDDENTLLIDMRNHYESEVGHFDGAWCPDVDTFREQLPLVVNELEEQKDKTVVMYCTGGIRCEKASAYLKHKGFKDVYHLERITDDIIASCHHCGEPFDDHSNCKNKACNLLFIQCPKCAQKYSSTCSVECQTIAALPEEEQRALRKGKDTGVRIFSKGRFKL